MAESFFFQLDGLYGAMNGHTPHFVLFSERSRPAPDAHGQMSEGWRFSLESADGDSRFVAGDFEPGTCGERLELLAVVRGLEALDQPSRVTLVTRSRYVSRGLTSGLETWRNSGWQWERFGKLAPVKNRDLWQRVDRALKFHRVECRRYRLDGAHGQGVEGRPLRRSAPQPARTADPARGRHRPRAGLSAPVGRPGLIGWLRAYCCRLRRSVGHWPSGRVAGELVGALTAAGARTRIG